VVVADEDRHPALRGQSPQLFGAAEVRSADGLLDEDRPRTLRNRVDGEIDVGSLTFAPQLDVIDSQVKDAVAKGVVLVDFWAEWCGPCQKLAPTIEQIANEFAGKAKVGKLDTDTGEFGGALLVDCNLRGFIERLSMFEVFGCPVVWVFSPDGTVVASSSKGGTIQLWSFPHDQCAPQSCELDLLPVSMSHSGAWDVPIAFWPFSMALRSIATALIPDHNDRKKSRVVMT